MLRYYGTTYIFDKSARICMVCTWRKSTRFREEDELLKLPIHVLHRIVSNYFKNNGRKLSQENEIIDFLFRCLDKFGKAGSVLFELVEFGEMSNDVYRRLLTDYSNIC